MRSFMESDNVQKYSELIATPSFKCAPPRMCGRQAGRSTPTPPYKGAPSYKCSVYYYWWRYLKLSEDYKSTCRNKGRGACAKIYKDFGDIHRTNFATWWEQKWYLFVEPPAAVITKGDNINLNPTDIITIQVDRSLGPDAIRRSLEEIHLQIHYPEANRAKPRSGAKYAVFARPILMTLHRQLQIYKLKTEFTDAPDAQIADWAGISVNDRLEGLNERQLIKAGIPTDRLHANMRRAKNRVVQRDYRMACSLIKNAAHGLFPKSDTR